MDRDGAEWHQITLGGSDGTLASGVAQAGKVIGPSFSASEVPDAIEAMLRVYRESRLPFDGVGSEKFVDTVRRVGPEPFKAAANEARTQQRSFA